MFGLSCVPRQAWGDDEFPRIAVYDVATGTWKHAFYPLDAPASQNGGWVGLSDIAPVGADKFYVLERDNQGGPDAAIKTVTTIDLGNYSFEDGTVLEKTPYRDLIPDLLGMNGQVYEKVEGLAVTSCGKVWINNDNDGVDDNSGEQALLQVASVSTSGSKSGKSGKPSKGGKNPRCAKSGKNGKKGKVVRKRKGNFQ